MGIKIKNLQTGEFEKFNIPALKGEKGEPGEIEPSEKVDYIGKQHSKLRDTMNANVDYIIKTAIGEFNYLDYEGQHITATNSIEGHAKSAILSGQTLVNVVSSYSFGGTSILYESRFYDRPFNAGETFTIFVVNPNVTTIKVGLFNSSTGVWEREQVFDVSIIKKVVFTVPSGYISKYVGVVVDNPRDSTGFENGLVVVQGDQSHLEVNTYFEGMQSVKMPVLTTIGVNIFEGKTERGYIDPSTGQNSSAWGDLRSAGYTEVIGGNTIRILVTYEHFSTPSIYEYDKDKNFIGRVNNNILSPHAKFVRFSIGGNTDVGGTSQVMLYYGDDIKREYEPYKSNILSTPEDLELRGIGEGSKRFEDELDCLTGELTQRIGEIVLDGTQDWSTPVTNGNFIKSYIRLNQTLSSPIAFCDKMISLNIKQTIHHNPTEECIWLYDSPNSANYLYVNILNSKLSSVSAQGLNEYFSNNNVKVYVVLCQPIIKTVDLSDNHVYSYKGTTHYSCSSEEGSLVPTLSVKVPTDTQLTIQEQKATTQTLLIKNMDLQQSIKEVQAMNLAFNTALYNSFNSIREEVEDIKKHVSTNENLEGSF